MIGINISNSSNNYFFKLFFIIYLIKIDIIDYRVTYGIGLRYI